MGTAASDEAMWRDCPIRTLSFEDGAFGRAAGTRRITDVPDAFAVDGIDAHEWLRRHGLRSGYAIPIVVGDSLLGILGAVSACPFRPRPAEQEILAGLADQAGIAIRNVRLLAASERRRLAAEALAEVGRLLTQSLEVGVVTNRILDSVGHLLRAHSPSLYRLDPASGALVAVAVSRSIAGTIETGFAFPPGTGMGGLAVRCREAVSSPNLLEDPRVVLTPELRRRLEGAPYRALLSVPLMIKDDVIGVLSVGDRAGRIFDDVDIHIARAFADQAAVAIENARVYTEATVQAQRMEALSDVGRMLSETLDLDVVGRRITDSVQSLLSLRRAVLYRLDPQSGELVVLARSADEQAARVGRLDRLPAGTGVAGRAVEDRVAVWTPDLLGDARIALSPVQRELLATSEHRAILGLPLIVQDRVIGALSLADRTGRLFEAAETDIARAFADQAALALHNARLYETAQVALGALQAKNAELDGFAYMVSHDLKAPLVTIQGMASMLVADCGASLDERGRHYLRRIEANIAQMERLITDVLALSRVGRDARPAALVSLTEVVDEVLAGLGDPIRAARVKVARHDLGAVWGIRTELEQVVSNLVSNAVKYIGDTPDPWIEIGAVERPGWLECYVRDSGIGIDPAYHQQVFEVFQRLKESPSRAPGSGWPSSRKSSRRRVGASGWSRPRATARPSRSHGLRGRGRGEQERIRAPSRSSSSRTTRITPS